MSYLTENIIEVFKRAREQKGLSQRALGVLAGVPQSHISKIENNTVDLRISSLIAIAHALDLEITLVARKALPAVKSVTRSIGVSPIVDPAIAKEFRKIEQAVNTINPELMVLEETKQLQRSVREINQFRNLFSNIDPIRDIRKSLESVKITDGSDTIKRAARQINALRSTLAHAHSTGDHDRSARPAYRLDGSDDG